MSRVDIFEAYYHRNIHFPAQQCSSVCPFNAKKWNYRTVASRDREGLEAQASDTDGVLLVGAFSLIWTAHPSLDG